MSLCVVLLKHLYIFLFWEGVQNLNMWLLHLQADSFHAFADDPNPRQCAELTAGVDETRRKKSTSCWFGLEGQPGANRSEPVLSRQKRGAEFRGGTQRRVSWTQSCMLDSIFVFISFRINVVNRVFHAHLKMKGLVSPAYMRLQSAFAVILQQCIIIHLRSCKLCKVCIILFQFQVYSTVGKKRHKIPSINPAVQHSQTIKQ